MLLTLPEGISVHPQSHGPHIFTSLFWFLVLPKLHGLHGNLTMRMLWTSLLTIKSLMQQVIHLFCLLMFSWKKQIRNKFKVTCMSPWNTSDLCTEKLRLQDTFQWAHFHILIPKYFSCFIFVRVKKLLKWYLEHERHTYFRNNRRNVKCDQNFKVFRGASDRQVVLLVILTSGTINTYCI